jgi:hypothetical protein
MYSMPLLAEFSSPPQEAMFHARNSSHCFSRKKRNLIIYRIKPVSGVGDKFGGSVGRRIFHPRIPSHALHGGFMVESAAISRQSSRFAVQVFFSSSNRGDATAVTWLRQLPSFRVSPAPNSRNPTNYALKFSSFNPSLLAPDAFYSTTRAEFLSLPLSLWKYQIDSPASE